jgi:two-component system cell cycle response regulator
VEVITTSCHGQSLDFPRLQRLMETSVLIVGGDQFCVTFLTQLRNSVTGKIETSDYGDEVISQIQTQQPEILILQAGQNSHLSVCRQVKAQSQLAWIYCIVIEQAEGRMAAEPCRQLALTTTALESGADAYLSMASGSNAVTEAENRLLMAQIQVGLRQVRVFQELMQTNDLLSSIALADPLTGVSNRRALEWELPRQIQQARTTFTPLSLIMLDVDYFKSVNDNYGHLVGDRVLQLLTARIRNHLRLQDTLFRYGGEEFVILLKNTNAAIALQVAHRVRSLISNQTFSLQDDLTLSITISLGSASLNQTDDTQGVSFLGRADQNLLKAKNAGRNQVVSED